MEFIKVRNTEEVVRIEITIEYVGPCKYIYVVSKGINYQYSTANVPVKPFPHNYSIGVGSELPKPGIRNNNWSFQLMNPSDDELEYEINIKWYQGDDKEPIYTWTRKNKFTKGKPIDDQNGECIYEF